MSQWNRREFLYFMGQGLAFSALPGCFKKKASSKKDSNSLSLPFTPIAASFEDRLLLAEGFRSKILIGFGDVINSKGDRFGTHNDFTCLIPSSKNSNEGLLWVNHEGIHPLLNHGFAGAKLSPEEKMKIEMKTVGGSILHMRNTPQGWKWTPHHPKNRRIDATTKIPLAWKEKIAGSTFAMGTAGNCAGGKTPWGTILTCEEGHDDFFGSIDFESRKQIPSDKNWAWTKYLKVPAEHYGWVVEVDPQTAAAKKLIALGRFAHEGATVTQSSDGRCVVYMGDDTIYQCLYKFIADKPGTLETGSLYVANMEAGRWELLDHEKRTELKKDFKSQTEVLIFCREAAKRVGGSPLSRPEDIEICPRTKAVYVSLTYNQKAGDDFGSLLKLEEKNADPLSLEFKVSTFMSGGPGKGFSCPDNLVFDAKGNLWMTNDISTADIGKKKYKEFGNNSLFYIPLEGPHAGEALRVATSPVEAEFTGPSFSPDGKTLFLSVQHPGELTEDIQNLHSTWPGGEGSLPRSSVVAISGPAMTELVS